MSNAPLAVSPQIRCEPFRLLVPAQAQRRWLYGEDIGPTAARHVFICLPGILETRASFDGLVAQLGRDHRIFLLDWPGRGNSDPMQDSKDYRMSQYLEDFGLFFAHIQGRLQASQSRGLSFGLFRSASPKRIHLVGTSMGGLLAMFFARYSSTTITSVVLNDVGCLLPWTSILGLMTEMQSVTKGSNLLGQTQDLARALDVDPRLLRAVQAPQHLDLPHETTLQGVDFGGVFQEVTLPILVLRGEDSEILNAVAAKHLMNCHPNTTIVSVPRAGHPVPYSDSVCKNMLSFCMRQDMDTKAQ